MLSRIKSIFMMYTKNSWTKLVLIFCTFCSCHSKTFRIAWLAPDQNSGQEINSFTSVAGLKLALTSVMANTMILNGHNIEVRYFPTDCTSHAAMQAAMKAKLYNPDVIIGPPCQEGLRMVAQLGEYWNLPVFTWYTPGIEFDSTLSYPTLVRMIPSLNTMGLALLHLFRQNNWNQFVFIHDDSAPWTLYEEAVRLELANTEVNLLSSYGVNSTVTDTQLWQMFSYIKKHSWVVVFACPSADIRRYMLIADQAGMGNGNYIFIQLDHQMHSEKVLNSDVLTKQRWMRGDAQDQAARRIYQSLIHVLLDPMNDDVIPTYALPRNRYGEFSRMAIPEATKPTPGWILPVGGKPDVYSLYLYDAILVWSVLVDRLDTAGKNYRDGKVVAQEARHFFADGATGYFALNDNLDRIAKMFILYMEKDGSFKPSQILRFNASDGYEIINIKPLREQTRRNGAQLVATFGQFNAVTVATISTPTTTTTTTTTKTVTAATTTSTPITTRLSRRPDIPPPPLPSKFVKPELAKPPAVQTTDSLINKLLAKVQSLEKSIKRHELHSHGHIPVHTHTPHPLLFKLLLSSTSAPPANVTSTQKTAVHVNTKAYQEHQVTTPLALSLDKLLGPQDLGHVPNSHQHIHVPTQPTNQIHSVTDVYRQQATSVQVPTVFNHAHHPHHWHPHPHYPHFNQGHYGHAQGTYMHQAYMPTTHRPLPIPQMPVETTLAPTTSILPTMTTAPPMLKPASHEKFNGKVQIDDAMLNRISSNIVDKLTGTSTNTTLTNNEERRILNDWLASGLEELGPGLLFAAEALREKRLLQQEKQRFYQQSLQNMHNNRQPIQNVQVNNQAQTQAPPVWQTSTYQDPLAAMFDPLAGLLGPAVVW